MRKKALDGLANSFHQALRSYLSTHPSSAYGHDDDMNKEDVSFLFLLAAAQFLPQQRIAMIFSLEQTSWQDLYSLTQPIQAAYSPGALGGDELPTRHSEELVRRMCEREDESEGWRPTLDGGPFSLASRSNSSRYSARGNSLGVIDEGKERKGGGYGEDDEEAEDGVYCYADTGLIIDYLYEVEEELVQHSPFATTMTSSGKSRDTLGSASSRRSVSTIRPVPEVDLERHIQIVRTVLTPLPFE
jgi:hypothetical protein